MYTKEQLTKSGFIKDSFCSFCQTEPETYTNTYF